MAKRKVLLTIFLIFSLASLSFSQSLYRILDLPEVKIDRISYLCLNDIVKILGGELYQDREEKKAIWYYQGKRLEFVPFSPYVLIDDSIYDLLFEVKTKRGKIFVPQKNFFYLLKETEKRVFKKDYKEEKSPLGYNNITDISASKKLNGILIELFISQSLNYEVLKSENNCLNIFFYQGVIDTNYFNLKRIPGIIKKMKAYQFKNSAQLSVWTKRPFQTLTQNLEHFPLRVQISLEDTTKVSKLAKTERKQNDLIDVVVVDPGHGGIDFGFFGPRGLYEKDVSLDIALRLRKLLEDESDLTVVLTREKDISLPLEKRARIANKGGGDLLISLHCGFSVDEEESGFEILRLGIPQKHQKKDSAPEENPDENDSLFSDSSYSPFDRAEYLFFEEAKRFAFCILDELEENSKISSRGISQKELVVLKKAFMPAISVKCGFISNPKEERLLAKSSFKDKIAEVLHQGILRYKIEYEREENRDI